MEVRIQYQFCDQFQKLRCSARKETMGFLIPKDESPLKTIHFALKLIGVDTAYGGCFVKLFSFYHFFNMSFGVSSAGLEIYFNEKALIYKAEAVEHVIMIGPIMFKFFKQLFYQKEIRALLLRLDTFRLQSIKMGSSQAIRKSDQISKKFFYLFMFIFFFYFLMLYTLLLTLQTVSPTDEPRFVVEIWVPWRITNFWNYIGALIYTSLILIPLLMNLLISLLFVIIITIQITTQLELLQEQLVEDGIQKKEVHRHYCNIMQVLRDFNNIFGSILAFELAQASIHPSIFGYLFMKALKSRDSRMVDMFYKFWVTFVIPFIFCFCGQQVTNQFDKLSESVYNSNWINMNAKERKKIIFFLMANCRQQCYSYKTVFNYDLACFCTVIQGVSSYLALMKNFDKSL